MPASNTPPTAENRFAALSPACLSKSEKSSVVALALDVLSSRYRPGRAFTAPEDIQRFLRLKLSGRRNEVFGIILLDTRHRLIRVVELFRGTVDWAAVSPRVVVQTQRDQSEAETLHMALQHVASADGATRTAIARAVWQDIHWLMPKGRTVDIAVRGENVLVKLGPPPGA